MDGDKPNFVAILKPSTYSDVANDARLKLELTERLLIHINRGNDSRHYVGYLLNTALGKGWLDEICCAPRETKHMWLSQIPRDSTEYNILASIAKDQRSPLKFAIEKNKTDIIEVMFELGLNPDKANDGKSCLLLHFAASNGNLEAIKGLLSREYFKQIINSQDQLKQTPLSNAVSANHQNLIKLLLMEGADPNIRDSFGSTPFLSYIRTTYDNDKESSPSCGYIDLLELMIEKGASLLDADTQSGMYPLHKAVSNIHNSLAVDTVMLFLKHGVNVNEQDKQGKTALHHLCQPHKSGHLPELRIAPNLICNIVQLLLENEANPNITDVNYNSPLHLAVQGSLPKLVEFLLQNGADPNLRNINGLKPLQLCPENLKRVIQNIFKDKKSNNKITYQSSVETVDGELPCSSSRPRVDSDIERIENAIDKIESKVENLNSVCQDNNMQNGKDTPRDTDCSTEFQIIRSFIHKMKTQREVNSIYGQFQIVADLIGLQWKCLLRELMQSNLMKTETVILELESRYPGQLREQAYQALITWHSSQQPMQSPLPELCSALTKCDCNHIVMMLGKDKLPLQA